MSHHEGHPHDCAGVWTESRKHGIVAVENQLEEARFFADVPTGPRALHHFEYPTYNLRFREPDNPIVAKIIDTGEERQFFVYTKWYIRSTPVGVTVEWVKDRLRWAMWTSDSAAGMVDTWTFFNGTPQDCTCIVDVVEEGGAYVQRGRPSRMQLPMYSLREARQGGNFPSTVRHEGVIHEQGAGCDMDHKDAPGDDSSGYGGLADYGADRTNYVTRGDARKLKRWQRSEEFPRILVSC